MLKSCKCSWVKIPNLLLINNTWLNKQNSVILKLLFLLDWPRSKEKALSFTSLTYICKLLIHKDQKSMQVWTLSFHFNICLLRVLTAVPSPSFLHFHMSMAVILKSCSLSDSEYSIPLKTGKTPFPLTSVFTWHSATYNCFLPDQNTERFCSDIALLSSQVSQTST